jgi:hypothetical protein
MGVKPMPIGTLEEIQEAGYNPQDVACCAPNSPGVRGCPVERSCRFARKRYGGFKGKGPKYVGYRLVTDEGRVKEDFIRCHSFIRGGLQARLDAGVIHRQQGKRGEFVRIIAQEGETIRQRVQIPVNPNDKSQQAQFKFETETITVPEHPRPTDVDVLTYDQEIISKELQAEKIEEEFDSQMAEQIMNQAADSVESGELKEPKKRGRPKGSKNKGEPDVGQLAEEE